MWEGLGAARVPTFTLALWARLPPCRVRSKDVLPCLTIHAPGDGHCQARNRPGQRGGVT